MIRALNYEQEKRDERHGISSGIMGDIEDGPWRSDSSTCSSITTAPFHVSFGTRIGCPFHPHEAEIGAVEKGRPVQDCGDQRPVPSGYPQPGRNHRDRLRGNHGLELEGPGITFRYPVPEKIRCSLGELRRSFGKGSSSHPGSICGGQRFDAGRSSEEGKARGACRSDAGCFGNGSALPAARRDCLAFGEGGL